MPQSENGNMTQQLVRFPQRALQLGWEATPGGHSVLRLRGELDSSTVAVFREAIAEARPETMAVIEMSGVPFVDSAGIGALIGGIRRLRELGGDVAVAAPRPAISRVLHMTGFDRIVPVADTVAEAAESLHQPAGSPPARHPAATAS